MKFKTTRDLIISGLLTALSIIIPMLMPRLDIPPFSATFASHAPVMLSMFISPWCAIFVAIGSLLGFIFRGVDPVIIARAAMHIPFALIGALILKKKFNIYILFLVTLLFHAGLESLVVLPFGFDYYRAFYITGIGTAIHHTIDFAITLSIMTTLIAAKVFPEIRFKHFFGIGGVKFER